MFINENTALQCIHLESMRKILNNNELKLIDNNEFESLFNIFFDKNHKSIFFAWLDYKVISGIFENSNLYFYKDNLLDKKYLQKIRIFDISKELMIWRVKDGFKGRFIIDHINNENEFNCYTDNYEKCDFDVIAAYQKLFGTKIKESNNKFTTITEDRGTTITLPLTGISTDKNNEIKHPVWLKTYNYVERNSIDQATYFDCRFVELCKKYKM